jgi:hypothetical protein
VRIPEVAMFAFATKGEALEVANHQKDSEIAAVYIKNGLKVAEVPVCFLVVEKEKHHDPR